MCEWKALEPAEGTVAHFEAKNYTSHDKQSRT